MPQSLDPGSYAAAETYVAIAKRVNETGKPFRSRSMAQNDATSMRFNFHSYRKAVEAAGTQPELISLLRSIVCRLTRTTSTHANLVFDLQTSLTPTLATLREDLLASLGEGGDIHPELLKLQRNGISTVYDPVAAASKLDGFYNDEGERITYDQWYGTYVRPFLKTEGTGDAGRGNENNSPSPENNP